MTTTFFLVRHAAHDDLGFYLAGRAPNVHLGPAGRAQALRLGERMRRETFAAIHASPRERTLATAEAISTNCGVGPVEISAALDEIDFGCWSGKTFADLNHDPDWQRWNAERSVATTPAGESMTAVRERVLGCMRDLSRLHHGEAVVLVSHADVIKSAVCAVLGLGNEAGFRFDIDPASITIVVSGEWGGKLLRLNEPTPEGAVA